jgi:hypothetical protein
MQQLQLLKPQSDFFFFFFFFFFFVVRMNFDLTFNSEKLIRYFFKPSLCKYFIVQRPFDISAHDLINIDK